MSDYNVGLNGAIYRKSDAVTNEAANAIADYEGNASTAISNEHVEWRGQGLYVKDSVLINMGVSLNFATMLFKPVTLASLYGITATSGSTREAAPATATVWEISSALATVPLGEYLIDVTRSSDEKLIQIWAAAGRVAGEINVAIAPRAYMTHDVSINCFLDANDKLLQITQASQA